METQGGLTVLCLLFPTPGSLEAIAQGCLAVTPQLAVREGEALFLEIGGSRSLFSPAEIVEQVQKICAIFAVKPRIALGAHAAEALAKARYGVKRVPELPLAALADFASPFQHDEGVAMQLQSLLPVLQKLGLKSVGDFLRLSPKTLPSRFGALASRIYLSIQGQCLAAWPRFQPPEKIVERLSLSEVDVLGYATDLEYLLFLFKRLCDRVLVQVSARGARVSVCTTTLFLEDRTQRTWRLELPFPQGTTAGLLSILHERLAFDLAQKPLSAPVADLELAVLETAAGHASQRDFFDRREEERGTWDELLGRLCARLGERRAFVAQGVSRWLPEGAWERGNPALGGEIVSPTPFPPRPCRLLKIPEPVRRDGEVLVHRQRNQSWHTRLWQGPERLCSEWWFDEELAGFRRDYYRVATVRGEHLWVFENLQQHNLYLHGYFD